MSIERLNQGTPVGNSLIPFFDVTNGRDAAASLNAFIAVILDGLSSSGLTTQYAAPNASGYTVTISPPDTGVSMWLLSTPLAGYAALTILLPVGADGQEVLVSSTQAVSGTLTVTGATVGASPQPVNGAPSTLAANGFFRLRFDGVHSSWYRVA